MENEVSYRQFIENEFARRIRRNPNYSLRAFARDLGVGAPKLSQALRNRGGFSQKTALLIAKNLKLSSTESEIFLTLVETEHARSATAKNNARNALSGLLAKGSFSLCDLDRFRVISDWFHMAILELTTIVSFRSSTKWVAERLDLSEETVRNGVKRLMQFGLLKEEPNGEWRATQADLTTPSGIPSREIREHHLQILDKAGEALEKVPVPERDFSTVTMAIDSARIEEARAELVKFRRKFCKDLQSTGLKDRVYCLAIQFFPLDQKPPAPIREVSKETTHENN